MAACIVGESTGKAEESNLAEGTGRAFSFDEPDVVDVRVTFVVLVCALGACKESEFKACRRILASIW